MCKEQRAIRFRLIKDCKIVGYELWILNRWQYAQPGSTNIWELGFIPHDSKDQLVGRTDKNGKEIFEGDFVESKAISKSEVLFIGGSFCFNNDFTVPDYFARYPKAELEIVGNIHENPELLEAKDE